MHIPRIHVMGGTPLAEMFSETIDANAGCPNDASCKPAFWLKFVDARFSDGGKY